MKIHVRLLRTPSKTMKPHNQNHWDRLMKVFDKNKSTVIEWDEALAAAPASYLKYCARMNPPLLEIISTSSAPEWSVTESQELLPIERLNKKIAQLERELEKTYALIGKLTVERGEL